MATNYFIYALDRRALTVYIVHTRKVGKKIFISTLVSTSRGEKKNSVFPIPILMQLKIDCAKMKFQQWIKNFYIGILK